MDVLDIVVTAIAVAAIVPAIIFFIPLFKKYRAIPDGVELDKVQKRNLGFLLLDTFLIVNGLSRGIPALYILLYGDKTNSNPWQLGLSLLFIMAGVCWLIYYLSISRKHLSWFTNKTASALWNLIPASLLMLLGLLLLAFFIRDSIRQPDPHEYFPLKSYRIEHKVVQ